MSMTRLALRAIRPFVPLIRSIEVTVDDVKHELLVAVRVDGREIQLVASCETTVAGKYSIRDFRITLAQSEELFSWDKKGVA